MVTPVPLREFRGGEFLHQVPGLGVEDPEERFVAEGGDFVTDAVDVVDGVAFGEVEVWLEGTGGRGGEGAGPGGPEGSVDGQGG